jgi:hypothetical protein
MSVSQISETRRAEIRLVAEIYMYTVQIPARIFVHDNPTNMQ